MLSPRGLLKFHTNLRIRYSIFERKWCWNFPRDFIKSIDHFEYYCSFITVSSSPWTQTTFNLFRSFISFSNVLQVLVHKSLLELVKFTYTYFIPWDIILNVIALFFLDFLMLLNKYTEGSKMVTGTQMQTAWAPWVRDLAETLEPHLVEVKNQGELILWTPSPWKASQCHDTLRKQVGHMASSQLRTCFRELQQPKQVRAKQHAVSLSHPWDEPPQPPWTDWSVPHKKRKTWINNRTEN
jgi:hypothetical protein